MGVAHHAAYAPWLEMARTEILREAGITYAALERAGVFLVVARMEIRYRRPVYYDDVLEVRTRVTGGGKVKIEHEYELALVEPGAKAAQHRGPGDSLTAASTTLVCVDASGAVRALPDWLVP
jgi:acyl-CoA thioester hydrolase